MNVSLSRLSASKALYMASSRGNSSSRKRWKLRRDVFPGTVEQRRKGTETESSSRYVPTVRSIAVGEFAQVPSRTTVACAAMHFSDPSRFWHRAPSRQDTLAVDVKNVRLSQAQILRNENL